MSGQVISRPARKHSCDPGWTDAGPSDLTPGARYVSPPSAYDYPAGTVWQCDCGLTWVSQGPPYRNTSGMTTFRRERWRERRRREKRERG